MGQQNRCLRCNRELKDPDARYGWRCAEIMGVSEHLNNASDEVWDHFVKGANGADEYLYQNNIQSEDIDIANFYESYIKQQIARSTNNEELYRQATHDMNRLFYRILMNMVISFRLNICP